MVKLRLRLLLIFVSFVPFVVNPLAAAPPVTFQNPLKETGADPWLTYFQGSYYFTATEGSAITMRTARHFADLKTAPDQLVWSDTDPTRFRDMWAPECHYLPDELGVRHWYLYYTAADGIEPHHRLYVLESRGPTPLGPYTFKAKLRTDPKDEFYGIDGTVLELPNHQLYFLWCGRPAETGQGLYISKMANAWTLEGSRTYLRTDGFGCPNVREAPEILQHGGKVFLVYSACDAATPDYKLGLLSTDPTANLLDPASWHQDPKPVFQADPDHGVWGPGHCFFFKSPDGTQDWIVYHAKPDTTHTYKHRSTRAQPFTWDADGLPDFGIPVPLDTPLAPPSGE